MGLQFSSRHPTPKRGMHQVEIQQTWWATYPLFDLAIFYYFHLKASFALSIRSNLCLNVHSYIQLIRYASDLAKYDFYITSCTVP